jgi:hypothetical protein
MLIPVSLKNESKNDSLRPGAAPQLLLTLKMMLRLRWCHPVCETRFVPGNLMPKQQFKAGTRKGTDGAGNGTVADYLLKLYQSQTPVIERAIETAALMRQRRLGSGAEAWIAIPDRHFPNEPG